MMGVRANFILCETPLVMLQAAKKINSFSSPQEMLWPTGELVGLRIERVRALAGVVVSG